VPQPTALPHAPHQQSEDVTKFTFISIKKNNNNHYNLNYSDNKNNASYETEHPHMAHKGNTFHTAAEHTCTTLHLSDYRTPYTGGAVTGTV